jgi:hypothetical protein
VLEQSIILPDSYNRDRYIPENKLAAQNNDLEHREMTTDVREIMKKGDSKIFCGIFSSARF